MVESEPIRPFSMEEAAPVLLAFSKLGQVTMVNANRFSRKYWPYVCWVDAPEFHTGKQLSRILFLYPGKGFWRLILDQPRLCLIVQPNSLRGESPFVIGEEERAQLQPLVEAEVKRLDESGVPVPWRATPYVSRDEFRAEKVSEMHELGSYLEQALGVQDKTSLGVEFSNESLELPLMEDRAGPGGGIILAADPTKFSLTNISTSAFDRAVHFWITEKETEELYSEMSEVEKLSGRHEGQDGWPLLSSVLGSEYGGLVVSPHEVIQLASELADFTTLSKSGSVRDALERLQSICRSAQNYHLGLYAPGK
jgi:hypothetical protein